MNRYVIFQGPLGCIAIQSSSLTRLVLDVTVYGDGKMLRPWQIAPNDHDFGLALACAAGVNEFYQKGCQEKSSASTGGEMFFRDPAHWN
jgi:hypothetical protein